MRNTNTLPAQKIRYILAAFSAGLTAALSFFVWIMLDVSHSSMSSVLLGSLLLVVFVTVAAQIIYALRGQIFEFDGRLATREILFAIICFQVVMQFSFGFSVYAVNQTELQNESFDNAYAYFTELQGLAAGNRKADYAALDLESGLPLSVEAVFLADTSADSDSAQYYRFPLSDGIMLMKKSTSFFAKHLQDFALSLLMSLVISVLLMAEMVYLAIKLIDNKMHAKAAADPADYLRQIAFLFYFTGFLATSFIPLMARDFAGSNPNADFFAGLPYSVEAFFNCAAILLTPRFFRKKGWKTLYLAGTGIFIAGLAASALSPNVYAFIGARALVGVGYGFCWMTLRNIASLSASSEKRTANFAGLSSGIYAGIMCGVAFGAVLADLAGYRTVLLISAAMALVAAIFPLTLRNALGKAAAESGNKVKLSARDIAAFAAFLVLICIPTCISEAFRGYLAPLYVSSLELPTAYIGRVSLIYNLCLVYLSSTVLLKIVWAYIRKPLYQTVLHMFIIAAALFATAYLGGFIAVFIAGALLGSADGFGFSVQNAYILDTRVAEKIGVSRMMMLFSLFKKFSAMLAPFVFWLFIMNGFQGLAVMGMVFIVCAAGGAVLVTLLDRREVVR